MVGLIVLTHGRIAEEMVKAASIIMGEIPACIPLGIDPEEKPEAITERLEQTISTLDQGQGVLILIDLFGGTPSNIALSFLQDKKVEVVSGVNLAMLLKVSRTREGKSLKEVAKEARDAGRQVISIASELMKKRV